MTNLHLGVPSGITAPTTGVGVSPSPVNLSPRDDGRSSLLPAVVSTLQCAVGGCSAPQHNVHTGFCEACHDRYMTRLYDMNRDIGRGDLP